MRLVYGFRYPWRDAFSQVMEQQFNTGLSVGSSVHCEATHGLRTIRPWRRKRLAALSVFNRSGEWLRVHLGRGYGKLLHILPEGFSIGASKGLIVYSASKLR